MNTSNQPTLFSLDTCGFGPAKSAQAVVTSLPPEPQVSELNFVFNTPLTDEQNIAYREWRILIQVIGLQINELNSDPNPEAELWRERISRTLKRVNEKGRVFKPECLPADIIPPTAAYLALSADGVNWLEVLTRQLEQLFANVQNAGILKIELFPQAAVPLRKDDTAAVHNAPALLEANAISIP